MLLFIRTLVCQALAYPSPLMSAWMYINTLKNKQRSLQHSLEQPIVTDKELYSQKEREGIRGALLLGLLTPAFGGYFAHPGFSVQEKELFA